MARRERVIWQELDYGLLAMLWHRPDYGYSVMNRLETRLEVLGLVAPPRNRVYESLNRLFRKGLVAQVGEDVETPGTAVTHIRRRLPRTRYRVTEAGEAAVRDYVAKPMPVSVSPSAFYTRLFCVPVAGVRQLHETLDAWGDACLEHLEQDGAPADPDGAVDVEGVIANLASLHSHLLIQVHLDWIAAARRALRRLETALDAGT